MINERRCFAPRLEERHSIAAVPFRTPRLWRLKSREVWMLHRICVIAGLLSTLVLMTPLSLMNMAYERIMGRNTGLSTLMRITCVAIAVGCSAAGIGRPSAGIGRAI